MPSLVNNDIYQKAISHSRFIVVEGIDGVGKTTAVDAIKEYLTGKGIPVVATVEPEGTLLNQTVRQIITDKDYATSQEVDLFLNFAGRLDHINKVILPALKNGKWIVSERYVDSAYAYHGCGYSIPISAIEVLDEMVCSGVYPDKTFVLDAPLKVCLERLNSIHKREYSQEALSFFDRAKSCYKARAENIQGYKLIDASVDKLDVQAQIFNELNFFM